MKNFLFLVLAFTAVIFTASSCSSGSDTKAKDEKKTDSLVVAMAEWEWKEYSLKFSAPDNIKVVKNEGTAFEAKMDNDNLEVAIYPWKDGNVTKDNVKEQVANLAQTLGFKCSEVIELNLNGFNGAYIICEKDGASCIIEGLIDPNSATNFYSVIGYTNSYEKQALEIANSFKK